jgi:hypothetical protein
MLRAQAHGTQQLFHTTPALSALIEAVDPERLADDVPHRHPRVQRGVRVLEDDLDVPPHRAHLSALERRDVLAVEDDTARRRLDELDDRATKRRLTAAGLPDDSECLALTYGEIDTIDSSNLPNGVPEDTGLDREVLDQPFHVQKGVAVDRGVGCGGCDGLGLAHPTGSASRTPACRAISSSAK